MADAFGPLAQTAGTGSAATVYTPGSGETVIIRCIRIVNTDAASANFVLYHDIDGSTYNAGSTIIPTTSLAGNGTFTDVSAICADENGSIGFNGPSTMTITLYGDVIT